MAQQTYLPYRSTSGGTREHRNVGTVDRAVSGAAAIVVASRLDRRKTTWRKALGVLSVLTLARKALTGRSRVYRLLGVSSAGLGQGAGIDIEAATTVKRPRAEVFEFWRDLTNLPLVMQHVEVVERRDDGLTHWKVAGPGGIPAEWDAEIINEVEDELIAWHSVDGRSNVEHSGSVHFEDAGDKGTEVLVRLRYVPPGLAPGFGLGRVLNPVTVGEVDADLRRLKHVMETGVDVTTHGQPTGARAGGA